MAKLWPWRRRSEGFEWHKYVRTTIALRREHRREKAEEIKRSAAEGAARAAENAARLGRQSASAAGDGARRMSRASARGLKGLAIATGDSLRRLSVVSLHGARRASAASARGVWLGGMYAGAGLKASGRWLARNGIGGAAWTGGHLATASRLAGSGLAELSRPLLDFLGRPGVSGPLMLAGAVALLSGLARPFLTGGVDRETVLVVTIGAICLIAGLAPRLRYGAGPAVVGYLAIPFQRLPPRAGHILAGGGAVLAVVAGVVWLMPRPSLPALPSMSLSSFVPFKASDPPITGRAWAISGDALRVASTTVRLDGIEALEREQICARGDNRRWRCGVAAQPALSRLIGGRQVHCDPTGKDAAGVVRATCTIGSTDLAAALVKGGHVLAETGMMPRYRAEQSAAREAKAGLWSGANEPERPAVWRARMWEEARVKAPQGCPIKGKVAGRRGEAKTYHLPWSPTYMHLRVISARGERWFCSEDEARAAGFAPPEIDG